MRNRWIVRDIDRYTDVCEGVHPIIQKILSLKGFSDSEEMLEFLSDKPQRTYDPALMKNIEEAVDVLLKAINENKSIWIYGDYDVDGVTSVSLMVELLSYLTDNCHYYIPSRFEEGYGLNKEALKSLKDKGADLVITVDCGGTSVNEVQYAKEIGLQIIITDHHNMKDEAPDCLVINPKQEGCPYPFKELCGCGVAFKLAQMVQRKAGLDKSILTKLLDLVAIATVSDIVPLVDENRVMVKYGLGVINKGKRAGLAALVEGVGLSDKVINAYHIAFVLGPHLNAGGRLDTADTGVQLFLTKDENKMLSFSKKLIELNRERRHIQSEGFETCVEIIDAKHEADLFLVIDAEDIHEGVAGIIAGKIKEKYYRPTIIVTNSNEEGIYKGTGRSVENINIYEEMNKYADFFLKFGGHASACGFSMKKDNLTKLRASLNEEARRIQRNHPEYFINEIQITLELNISDLTEDLINALNSLEPFGHKNEKPIFLISDLAIVSRYYLGARKDHLKLICQDQEGRTLEVIGFNMANDYRSIEETLRRIDLVGYPGINEYNGIKKIQFQLKDFRSAEEADAFAEAY